MPTSLSTFLGSSYQGAQGVQGTSGLNSWSKKTSNYTAVNGDRIIADTTSGSFTITLPATPTTGNSIIISDGNNWSVNNLIVARNGSTIEELNENLTIDIAQIAIEFVYDGTTWEVYPSVGVSPNGFDAVNYLLV
jgi:hypothetical protein